MVERNHNPRVGGSSPSTAIETESTAQSRFARRAVDHDARHFASQSPLQSPHRDESTSVDPGSLTLSIAAILLVIALAIWATPTGTSEAASAPAPAITSPCRSASITPIEAINCTWPRSSRATARRVAECESTASANERIARARNLGRWARNGKYVGVFQLGPNERADHGWYRRGASARIQVASALSLYRARGWQPWTASQHCWGGWG